MHLLSFPLRRAAVLILAAICCAVVPASAQTAPAPIAPFFQQPAFGDAVLSPNGKNLATRVVDKNGHYVLAVIDLESRAAKIVAGYAAEDIRRFQWVNDERLVYNLFDRTEAQGDVLQAPGLFAVNLDGSRLVQLAERRHYFVKESTLIKKNILPWHTWMMAPGAQDSEFIYVTSTQYKDNGRGKDVDFINLLRLNTITGTSEVVPRPGPTRGWLLDHKGQPRLATTVNGQTQTIH
ncbi:MAG: hypothetical protein M3Y65_10740 [Pseudomonadota bacterium]|nr:hypothetical protein [Pseudomonadota bacterium]